MDSNVFREDPPAPTWKIFFPKSEFRIPQPAIEKLLICLFRFRIPGLPKAAAL
jgi:hypothetical protein